MLRVDRLAKRQRLCEQSLSALQAKSSVCLRTLEPEQLLAALRRPPSGHRPKLRPERVGPLARFLVDNPQATLPQVRCFARTQLGVSVSS